MTPNGTWRSNAANWGPTKLDPKSPIDEHLSWAADDTGNAAACVRLMVWCLDCRHQVEPDPAGRYKRVIYSRRVAVSAASTVAASFKPKRSEAIRRRARATWYARCAGESRQSRLAMRTIRRSETVISPESVLRVGKISSTMLTPNSPGQQRGSAIGYNHNSVSFRIGDRNAVEYARYPFAPRLDPSKAILAKLDPPTPRPELPLPLRPSMGLASGEGEAG